MKNYFHRNGFFDKKSRKNAKNAKNSGGEKSALRYDRTMDERKDFLRVFPKNEGRVLFCVSEGRDLSKLDLKAATELSMSTVLSCVEKLLERKYITIVEEKRKSGGKPRSSINLSEDVFVYGVSYKGGILTAVKASFKGEVKGVRAFAIVDKSVSPIGYVLSLLNELSEKGERPAAIGLAINAADPKGLIEEIKKAFDAPVFLTSNTGAVAALTLFREKAFPICALGIGVRIKCALYGETSFLSDISELSAPCSSGGGNAYADVLSVPAVEARLTDEDFRGNYYFSGERYEETRNKRDYSELLVGCLSSLTLEIAAFTRPARLVLFGDYVTQGLFERVKISSPEALTYFPIKKEDLALGAACYALKEGVFNE